MGALDFLEAGEAQLGQSDNPKDLVHGDAAKIRSVVSELRTFANGFGETADGLNQIVTGHWEGRAADAFRSRFSPEPAKWSTASTAMGRVSSALENYASAVESAQGQAQQAIDLWNQGQDATHSQHPSGSQHPSDPGAPLRDQARKILAGARQARDTAAGSAKAAITASTNQAPPTPSIWSRIGDDISDGFSIAGQGIVSFGAGIMHGISGIVRFGRTLDPVDPWNMRHPVEFAAGISGTVAGLVGGLMDPVKMVKGMVGSGWSTDPAEALGNLVPNIALTVGTDGGGAAASVGEDAAVTAGEDVAENTAADAAENTASRPVDSMNRVGDPVDVATGDVVMTQTDVSLPGALPLIVARVHRSSQRGGGWFGKSWVSSLDQRLLVTADRIAAVFADGQVLLYPRADLEGGGPVLPKAGPRRPLTRDAGGAYTVTDPGSGLTWRYAEHPGLPRWSGDGQGELPLVSVTDRAGHEITFGRDEHGRPASVTHSGGYQVNITVSSERITVLSSGDVPLVRYAYDEAGNLTAITNSSGQPLRLFYDPAGRLAGWADRNRSAYRYTYDERGRCVRGESPSGALSAAYSYDDGVTRWTNAAGEVTEYVIDRAARVTAINGPLGNTTRFTYDPRNRKTSETDALGRVTRYAYDDFGNLVSVIRPDGETAQAVYDERGQAVELHEPGRPVRYQEFDDLGNLTSATRRTGRRCGTPTTGTGTWPP